MSPPAWQVFLALDARGRGLLTGANLLPLLAECHRGYDALSAAACGLPTAGPDGDGGALLMARYGVDGAMDFAGFMALVSAHPAVLFPLLRLQRRARAATLGACPTDHAVVVLRLCVGLCSRVCRPACLAPWPPCLYIDRPGRWLGRLLDPEMVACQRMCAWCDVVRLHPGEAAWLPLLQHPTGGAGAGVDPAGPPVLLPPDPTTHLQSLSRCVRRCVLALRHAALGE